MTEFESGRGKVVWLPTSDAEYAVTRARTDAPYGSVVTDGQPAPELAEIFQIIADNDLVLATGHSSPEEVLLLLPEARRRGVRNILNHPRVGAESDAGSSGAHGESGGDHGTRLSWRSPIHDRGLRGGHHGHWRATPS